MLLDAGALTYLQVLFAVLHGGWGASEMMAAMGGHVLLGKAGCRGSWGSGDCGGGKS